MPIQITITSEDGLHAAQQLKQLTAGLVLPAHMLPGAAKPAVAPTEPVQAAVMRENAKAAESARPATEEVTEAAPVKRGRKSKAEATAPATPQQQSPVDSPSEQEPATGEEPATFAAPTHADLLAKLKELHAKHGESIFAKAREVFKKHGAMMQSEVKAEDIPAVLKQLDELL